jgi:hypothetical protein
LLFKKPMIVKILGVLDIFIGLCFWLFGIFNIIPESFILILGLFLLVKGVVFITGLSVTSFLDIICAVIIIVASSVNMPNLVVIFVAIFLIQKGVFSLFG